MNTNTSSFLDGIKKNIRINHSTLIAESCGQFYKKNSYLKFLFFISPLILFLFFLGIKIVFPSTYTSLIQEDGAIEYLQAFLYCLSSIFAFLVSSICLKNKFFFIGILYVVLAFGLLFVTLEEISWGQRIFTFANPDYFSQNNTQNELSFHNLKPIQRYLHKFYILTGAYGAFAWLFLSRKKMKYHTILTFVVPDWFISSSFVFVFFIYTLFDYVSVPHLGGFLVFRDQEPCELLLSLGFLFFTISNYLKLRIFVIRQRKELKQ
jgi:hypothetical protein